MKLTDEQIDKLFQDGAAKQSFAYKPEFWEEFSSSLSNNAPLSEASDDALDAAFQEEAAKQSIAYKPEFWEEFSATLPDNTPLSQVPDDALDSAFQKEASNIAVAYKPEFWSEFSDELSSIASTENVTDNEVDAMYRDGAAKLSFVYHPSYWEEMAAMLRRRRRRPEFLWFGLSGVFTATIIAMFFIQQGPLELTVPEFVWNGINPAQQRANNVTSNASNNSENDAFQNTNDVQNGNIASNAGLNGTPNGNTPNNIASNGNNPMNGSQVNLDPTLVPNHQQVNPNNAQITPRLNRVTPNLVMTTVLNEPTRAPQATTTLNSSGQETVQDDITLDPLSAKSLGTLSTLNNELAEVEEFPGFRPYKRAPLTSFYVQGVGGISESLITPSDAFGTSYGIGAGIMAHKRNWTFNIGSNVVIENYSDLELTRVAKQYVHFSSTESRQDLQYRNLYSVELDLGVGYNFGRHQVHMGIRPSYTYNARVDYSETNIYNSQGEMIETSESRQGQYGYLGALQLWGLKPTIGYGYSFPSNWSIGLNIGTELRQSINEEFISGVNNRLPLDGQLYIRKTLNFKK
ncbi:hypothetical protein N9355_01020 [Crocinitomicaceae bacterium]|nr:hypothetical protein [Crocinitomicaceae bacterium]